MNRSLIFLISFIALPHLAFAVGGEQIVRFEAGKGDFKLSAAGKSAPLVASSQDHPGLLRVLRLFQKDIAAVTGATPEILLDTIPRVDDIVIVGTIGKSPLIDRLIRNT